MNKYIRGRHQESALKKGRFLANGVTLFLYYILLRIRILRNYSAQWNILFVVISQKSWMGIILILQKATEAKIKKFCRRKARGDWFRHRLENISAKGAPQPNSDWKMNAALKRAPHPNKRRSKTMAEKISAAALIWVFTVFQKIKRKFHTRGRIQFPNDSRRVQRNFKKTVP